MRKQLAAAAERGLGAIRDSQESDPQPTGSNIDHADPTPDDRARQQRSKASEVEDMAAKQGEGTKRCYMRAQKGALGFEIADIKKIDVTLTVGKDGAVSDVGCRSTPTTRSVSA